MSMLVSEGVAGICDTDILGTFCICEDDSSGTVWSLPRLIIGSLIIPVSSKASWRRSRGGNAGVEADKDMITEHENDLELVEQKEAELNKQLSGLETSLKELETLKKDLSKQQKEKAILKFRKENQRTDFPC